MHRGSARDLPAERPLAVRLAALSTSAMIADALDTALRRASYAPTIAQAEFGTVVADLLSPPGEAGVMIVVLDEHGLLQRDWRLSAEEAQQRYEAWLDMLTSAMDSFARQQPRCHLLINTVPQPASPAVGYLDAIHPDGQSRRIGELNRRLREIAAARNNVCLIESDVALASVAPAKRSDPKLWFYGRIPFSAAADAALAAAFTTAIEERARPRPKVLALDLDDTLWRGIYGEAGALGVECGTDFPGNAFRAFQLECLRLKAQGVLLAILSKNDPAVLEVFDKHPGMVLRRSDFVATRINWAPKPDNIRELAAELNLGLDTFVFIDDSPHEREAMRQLAAPVRVLDVPADPALRPDMLRSYWPLWPLRLTKEDAARTDLYSARLEAQKAMSTASNLGQYLASLDQKLVVKPVSTSDIGRIAQMHDKTNQFNLTTRRYSAADLDRMTADADHHLVLQGSVSDQFGDHGVVICATTRISGREARITSFLMSCRVIAREVEFAFLGALIDALAARGVTTVVGQFIPTERNGPAADFLEKAGFSASASDGETGQLWAWRADHEKVPRSSVVDVLR